LEAGKAGRRQASVQDKVDKHRHFGRGCNCRTFGLGGPEEWRSTSFKLIKRGMSRTWTPNAVTYTTMSLS